MKRERMIPIDSLDDDAFSPYGWLLGCPFSTDPAAMAYTHPVSDFWHVHDFDPGAGGETEILWVKLP